MNGGRETPSSSTEVDICCHKPTTLDLSILHVDASKDDLGCALYQQQQDQLRVIGYGIRTLAIAEKRYHISKMEYLALKYVAYDDFKSYLFYAKYCEVFTDNKRLLYATSTTNLNATGQH